MQPQALQLVGHHPLKQSQRVELSPHSHSGDGLLGPDLTMVVYMGVSEHRGP